MEDYSIIYNGKLKEAKNNLDKLKSINMQADSYKKSINSIDRETKRSIRKNYELFTENDQAALLNESNAKVYKASSDKIDKINQQIISEYDIYYKINNIYESLLKKVDEVSEDNIAEITSDCRKILAGIRTSSNIDYAMEKELVEKIYELTYKIIKLELVYSDSAGILFNIKENPNDFPYIVEQIRKDIDSLDDNLKEVKIIKEKILDLKKNGLKDEFLLDRNIITLLALATDDKCNNKIKEKFINSINNHQDLAKNFENSESETKLLVEQIEKLQKNKHKNSIKSFKRRILLTLNFLLVSASITGSAIALGNITKKKEYKVTTTVYDSSIDDIKTTEDYEEESDKLEITEYGPWDEPGYFRDTYSRNVYKYNLENLDEEFSNIKQYLDSSIKDKLTFENTLEEVAEKPKDTDYGGNKYIITKKLTDKNDFRRVYRYPLWPILCLISSAGIILVDILALKKILSKSVKITRQTKKKVKQEIKTKKIQLIEEKNNLDILSQELLLSKLQARSEFANLPDSIKEIPEIKEKILILNDNNR